MGTENRPVFKNVINKIGKETDVKKKFTVKLKYLHSGACSVIVQK